MSSFSGKDRCVWVNGPSGLGVILERAHCIPSLWQLKTYDRLKQDLPKKFQLPEHYLSKRQFIEYLACVQFVNYDEVCRLKEFGGEVIHACDYKRGEKFRGKKVVVVGCGNSGMEVSLDLCNHDVQPSMVCRSAVHVLPRDIFGKSTFEHTQRKIPFLDIGALEKIRSGKVKVFPGINKFSCEFESVVLVTGYCSTVPYWLKESEFVCKNDYLKAQYPNKWKGKCRVGFEKRKLAGASAFIRKGQNSAHRISFKF
ncbi:hypothetical protein KY290_037096 [Solanum tuberosum]|uniref:Flavin-containing monooxygenase n=1 Tax=Solanum tuberosum TaxID=4113 RepID=A0ABQ7TW94_SOLTU|nr:hypothetical protein KY285_036416 [Solanum tuberosum]KAH0738391.1 hypothetical protein KY290_037096 [Solanum tuberosum]